MKHQVELISNSIRPVIEAEGGYLEEVTITPAGRRSLVTVLIDSDRHLSLDEVTGISRQISEVVENMSELGDDPFTLEVSSPGIDRPLTLLRHFKKNIGRLVNLVVTGEKIQGRITEVSDETITLDTQAVAFADIEIARLEIEFK